MEIDRQQDEIISEARTWIVRRIKAIRLARGYNQRQVAKKMGVGLSRVSDLELELNDYKVSTMLRAAYALGVTAEALVRGCPGFLTSRHFKDQEPVVIATASRLRKALKDHNIPDHVSERLVAELVLESV